MVLRDTRIPGTDWWCSWRGLKSCCSIYSTRNGGKAPKPYHKDGTFRIHSDRHAVLNFITRCFSGPYMYDSDMLQWAACTYEYWNRIWLEKTCETEYRQLYRRFNSRAPNHRWHIAQARPMSVSDISRSLPSWVTTTHRSYSLPTYFIKRNTRARIRCGSFSYSIQSGEHCRPPTILFLTCF